MNKDKDNILVDMYNLKLTENPEQDKNVIIEFFKKYDPAITKYLTAKEVEGITDFFERAGSLGDFEAMVGRSWFQTEDVKDFYNLWHLVKELIDAYLNDKPITQWQLIRVEMLLENIKPSLIMGNKETRFLTNVSWIPQEIEPKKYNFMQGISAELNKISGNQESTKIVLPFGLLKYNLFKAILQFLNGETIIRKCLANDCQKAFIPTTLKQVYHTNTCRTRIAKRRERSNIEVS